MISKRTTIVFAAMLTAMLLPMGTINIAEAGSGDSSSSKAQIDLYDSGTKPAGETLTLTDSYSGCLGVNAGEFTTTVYSDKTTVSWDAKSTYWHSCLLEHQFSGGQIKHEGQTHSIPSDETSGSKDFNNTGTSPYSVDVEFYYD